MIARCRPNSRPKGVATFDVHIKSTNSTSIHMVPEYQTLSITICYAISRRFQAGVVSRFARWWRLDVHVATWSKYKHDSF